MNNYTSHIENLKSRRFDEVRNECVLSNGFFNGEFPDVLRYAMEAMQEVDPSYSYKLFSSFRRTQELLVNRLRTNGIEVDARYQGPVNTQTHIDLYGGLELLLILKKPTNNPSKMIQAMSTLIVNILDQSMSFNQIDYTDRHKIRVQTKKPVSDVTILPAVWVESSSFKKTHLEINRGICEYNFLKKTRKMYMPFLNMARLNSRDKEVGGSLKNVIRLLLSLQADSAEPIDLTYDEIVGLLYNMPDQDLKVSNNKYFSILPNVSLQIQKAITDTNYRETMLSPSRMEYVFGKKQRQIALQRLKNDLDGLIDSLNAGLKRMNKSITSAIVFK